MTQIKSLRYLVGTLDALLSMHMETKKEYIIASNNIQDLTGVGYELLLDQHGDVIAMFYNGNMTVTNPTVTEAEANEVTKLVA
jgi:hypothetical protein